MDNLKEKMYKAFQVQGDIKRLREFDSYIKDIGNYKALNEIQDLAYTSYREDWILRYIYNSNAIEGSTLTVKGTKLVLEGEFPPHDEQSNLRDVFAAIGVRDGYDYALKELENKRILSVDLIKDIHEHTAYDSQPATRGLIRDWPVYIVGSNTVPPDSSKVREYLDDLIYFYNNSQQHPIVKAAAMHVMFENIHPFSDCNGRTGRALLNYSLLQSGLQDITIKCDNKQDYYEALENWQVNDKPNQFINMVLNSEIFEFTVIKDIKDKCPNVKTLNEYVQSVTKESIKESCSVFESKKTKNKSKEKEDI